MVKLQCTSLLLAGMSDGKTLAHLLKSRMAMTMMMMSTTARTGPITQSISGWSTGIGFLSCTMMGSEYGLAEKVRYRERKSELVHRESNKLHNNYG